jgi:hypothetical protein
MYPSPSFRASDADREAVVAHLSTSLAEGRLSLAEFDARTRHVYAARTWGELRHIVRDLPPLPPAPAPPKPAADPAWPVVSLICGVLSIPLVFCAPVGIVLGVAAVVFGVLGLHPRTRGSGRQRGLGLAGLICGVAGVLISVTVIVLVATLESGSP